MPQEILLTQSGFEKLSQELNDLKFGERAKVADAIREAKSHGDLKENAAYHEAKLNQTRLEGRIADLEKVLQQARIVERPAHAGEVAHLGSKVTLKDLNWGDEMIVTLVGSYEADPANDMISITSPMGSALLDKAVDDEIEVQAPAGTQKYKILKID